MTYADIMQVIAQIRLCAEAASKEIQPGPRKTNALLATYYLRHAEMLVQVLASEQALLEG